MLKRLLLAVCLVSAMMLGCTHTKETVIQHDTVTSDTVESNTVVIKEQPAPVAPQPAPVAAPPAEPKVQAQKIAAPPKPKKADTGGAAALKGKDW